MSKTSDSADAKRARIFYARVDEFARKEDKYKFLDDAGSVSGVEWQELQPDAKHTWLTKELREDFESFIALGSKESKKLKEKALTIFSTFSNGVKSNNDAYVYNFDETALRQHAQRMVEDYNAEVDRWKRKGAPKNIDGFIDVNEERLKWIRNTKRNLLRGKYVELDESKIRVAIYRPFCVRFYFIERIFNEDIYRIPNIFPNEITEKENILIWLKVGSEWPMFAIAANYIPDVLPQGGSQCFPLYTYNEDGTNRRENITDWALSQFRTQYKSKSISKLDIFHYVYALLHHPAYRATYAANLKRELPRIPLVASAEDFLLFARAGERLADLHVHYETQAEYKLEHTENTEADLNWRVERMRLSKDKRSIIYNDFLTLEGIPPEAFEYRLGNRSALEWIIDQYRVSTDKRSGITNDPNRADEPDYIVKLICKVTTVSVETVKTVQQLPALDIP